MSTPHTTNEDSDYEYANAYFYFWQALDTISRDALQQCEIMDYFNVAWELRDDATTGANSILTLPGGQLSTKQRQAVDHFLVSLDSLPESAVNVENTREENLRAMSSAAWSFVRLEARRLKKILELETERTSAIICSSTGGTANEPKGR
jgi:hypothetical protein